MPSDSSGYQDLGADHFDRCVKAAPICRLVVCLHDLGDALDIEPLAA
jgi:hypothetical protein